MSRKNKNSKKTRAEPISPTVSWFISSGEDDGLCVPGYTRLADAPEVRMAIERIADLISTMTIHLMENSGKGDIRIKNALSRKIDIQPCNYMTRQLWVSWIVKSMILNGNAIVYPKFVDGLINNLIPIPYENIEFNQNSSESYSILIDRKSYSPDELLHFRINPREDKPWIGESYKITLKDVIQNLKQARHTTNEFMANRVIPNLIVKVDALTDELTSNEGRARVYDKYLSASKAGEPWIIPAGLMEVQQVKPLTLNDIAIKDTIELDKKTVAGILGVPAFLLGIGGFIEKEYNNFIRTRIRVIAMAIEQELTQKLLISPTMYFKFNSRSLYSYGLTELVNVYSNMYIRGLVTGNEVRDIAGMSPRDELDELTILENFIPLNEIGNQSKLTGGDNEDEQTNEDV